CGLLARRCLDLGDRYLRPFTSEPDRRRTADARSGPGDERHFACETWHLRFLPQPPLSWPGAPTAWVSDSTLAPSRQRPPPSAATPAFPPPPCPCRSTAHAATNAAASGSARRPACSVTSAVPAKPSRAPRSCARRCHQAS